MWMILSLQFSGRKEGSVAKTPENTALSGARPRGKACATPNMGYHLCVGGGWGADKEIGRRLLDSVPFDEIPPIIERLLLHYLARRAGPEESFAAFARRHSLDELRAVVDRQPAAV
jgi:sulfite reductase beta subunit-like hemoprotein